MYTVVSQILYPEASQRGDHSPVNIREAEAAQSHSKCQMSLGFLFGGFSSTAGYVSGNEAQHPKM